MATDESRVAVLEEKDERRKEDLGRAFRRIEDTEQGQREARVRGINDENKFQALGASVESLKDAVEALGGKVSQSEQNVMKRLGAIEGRIAHIEGRQVDRVRVLRWLGTWRGLIFLCFAWAVLIGALFPDSRGFIMDVLGLTTPVKGG